MSLPALAAPLAPLHAQDFPSRPITLIVPLPAGGPVDRHLRALAELVAAQLGQPVVVENRPGASGTLAPTMMAASARADGYTVCSFQPPMLRLPHMQKTRWHPIHDFSFIVGLARFGGSGFLVRADSPFKAVADYVAAARSLPQGADYGTAGMGSSNHLMVAQLAQAEQVALTHVPFRGNPDMMQALLGGHVMAVADVAGWEKLVDEGRLRLLMTFGDRPDPRYPTVPTATALGYAIVSNSCYGLVGPKDMPAPVVKVLHDAFRQALLDPRHAAVLEQLNLEAWPVSGTQFRLSATQTFEREGQVLERLGLALR